MQIAFVRVLENFQRLSEGIFSIGTEEDLRKWLRQICLNASTRNTAMKVARIRDFRKDEPIQPGFEQQDGAPSPSSECCQKERDDMLVNAINGLPEVDRILLRLKDSHAWSYASLAELVDGRETNAGRVRLQRRITQLRFELRQNDSLQDLG